MFGDYIEDFIFSNVLSLAHRRPGGLLDLASFVSAQDSRGYGNLPLHGLFHFFFWCGVFLSLLDSIKNIVPATRNLKGRQIAFKSRENLDKKI